MLADTCGNMICPVWYVQPHGSPSSAHMRGLPADSASSCPSRTPGCAPYDSCAPCPNLLCHAAPSALAVAAEAHSNAAWCFPSASHCFCSGLRLTSLRSWLKAPWNVLDIVARQVQYASQLETISRLWFTQL